MEPGDSVRPARASAKKLPVVDATGIYEHGLSGFGLLARMASTGRLDAAIAKARLTGNVRVTTKVTPPFQDEDDGTLIPGGQAEFTIAVDVTGNNVVAGFNDTRGFSLNPISVSGYAYSSNGGTTFTDGGTLPAVTVGHVGATNYPQVFGDPDIKYVPGGAGCQFIYSSIAVVGLGAAPNYTGHCADDERASLDRLRSYVDRSVSRSHPRQIRTACSSPATQPTPPTRNSSTSILRRAACC